MLVTRAPWPVSFAQHGEDMLAWALLHPYRSAPGAYADIGAHHPWRWSNTYHLYLYGWRGVNVDPTRGMAEIFRLTRPGDAFVEAAVGMGERSAWLYTYPDTAVNTVRAGYVEPETVGATGCYEIPCRTLGSVLAEALPQDLPFDLLSVDVEGGELDVLMSNDWDRYRPILILVEDNASIRLEECVGSSLASFLGSQGYLAAGRCVRTTLFVDGSRVVGTPSGWWIRRT